MARKRVITRRKSKRLRKTLRKPKRRMLGGSDKIKFHNWWSSPTIEEGRPFFNKLFAKCIDRFDEVNIYSQFPATPPETKNSKVLTVQYSGESHHMEPGKFDINIIAGDNAEGHVTMPHIVYVMAILNRNPKDLTQRRKLTKMPSKFCLFSVSNPTPQERVSFFNALSKYKQVDSCGKVLKNMEECKGTYISKEYHQLVSNYKFMICFENTSMKNYLTEKLLIAYIYGAIPIYWGCSNLEDYVDTSSILHLKPDFKEEDLQALVKEVEALDKDDELYRKKYESIFFKDAKVPDAFDINALNKNICKVIDSKNTASASGGAAKYGTELILNMEKEADRYEELKPIVEAFGITPTFVVGKDKVSTHPLYHKFDTNQNKLRNTASEISAAINHIECIKKHKDTNDYVLIFESDVKPLYSIAEIKRDIENVLHEMEDHKIDFVFLGKGHLDSVNSTKLSKFTDTLFKWRDKASRCAESYIVSPNGIARYLEYVEKEPHHVAIDWDFNYFFRKNDDINVAWRIPELFKQNKEKFASSINHTTNR